MTPEQRAFDQAVEQFLQVWHKLAYTILELDSITSECLEVDLSAAMQGAEIQMHRKLEQDRYDLKLKVERLTQEKRVCREQVLHTWELKRLTTTTI